MPLNRMAILRGRPVRTLPAEGAFPIYFAIRRSPDAHRLHSFNCDRLPEMNAFAPAFGI